MDSHIYTAARRYRTGLTLVELLVGIVIVAAMTGLSVTMVTRGKVTAAQAASVNRMRGMNVAIHMYMADKSLKEPFFATDGIATFPEESSTASGRYAAPNPAAVLYNVEAPHSGYIQDPSSFFSPLVRAALPSRASFNPDKAKGDNIWGTYAWFHPFVAVKNGRHLTATNHSGPVNPEIDGKFLMTEWYTGSAGPAYQKQIHHALMLDGSVLHVADSQEEFDKWRTEQ